MDTLDGTLNIFKNPSLKAKLKNFKMLNVVIWTQAHKLSFEWPNLHHSHSYLEPGSKISLAEMYFWWLENSQTFDWSNVWPVKC